MKKIISKERNIITDKLVAEKTGRTMEEWFIEFDKMKAKQMKHSDIFAPVSSINDLKPRGQWNQNLLTTTYEWNRGLKERGQRDDGFEISVSKTISVSNKKLFDAWNDTKNRNKWLDEKNIEIRKATENKSLVITWSDKYTTVRVEIYNKGTDKSQVVVQHMKIADSRGAEEMKSFWSNALVELKTYLEE